jgi:hypothetical protein
MQVCAKFPITNSVSIQPEISYTTKGAELSYNNALQTEQLRLKQIILKFLYYSFSTLQMHSTYMLDHMQLTW